MSENKYVNTKKAKELLGVHAQTLHNWERSNKIETIRTAGGHRLYNVEKYMKENGQEGCVDEEVDKEED